MNIKDMTKAILTSKSVRLWKDMKTPGSWYYPKGWVGTFLLLGDDGSINDFIAQYGKQNPKAYEI